MIKLSETIQITAPKESAFAYIADFSSVKEWDPQVIDAFKLSDGPIGLGTEFRVIFNLGVKNLDITYEITEFNAPHAVTFKGTGKGFIGIDRIQLSDSEKGTAVHYEARLTFPGSNSILQSGLSKILGIIGRKAMQGLKQCLDENVNTTKSLPLGENLADRLVVPGMLGFSDIGYRLRRRSFPPIDARLDGKTVLITGASSGLGYASALALADLGAKLILLGRNESKLVELVGKLETRHGRNDFQIFTADFAEPKNVELVAKKIKLAYPNLDIIIHNAGILENEYQLNSEGLERSMAVNIGAPYHMTKILLPCLKKGGHGRIILVSSGGMYPVKFNSNRLKPQKDSFNGVRAYAMAKRSQVILAEHWANEFSDLGVVVHSMHPGWANTPGVEGSLPGFYRLTKPLLRSASHGADTIVWLAAAREPGLCTGKFWHDRRQRNPSLLPGTAHREEDRVTLIEFLEAQNHQSLNVNEE